MQVFPSFREFQSLSRHFNFIPVWCEVLGDLETPVSAYRKLVGSQPGFLLESVAGGEKLGRYSFLGVAPIITIRSRGTEIEVERSDSKTLYRDEPLSFLRQYLNNYRVPVDPTLPRFSGGLVGYFGYNLVRFWEELPDIKPDNLNLPDMQVFLADTLVAFDHFRQRVKFITHANPEGNPKKAYEQAVHRLTELLKRLNKPWQPVKMEKVDWPDGFQSDFTPADFGKAVQQAKDYIRKGDAIQVVLSQRLTLPLPVNSERCFEIYRAVRSINPSPYLYYLNFGPMQMIGSSPEVMVRLEGEVATLRPIAGTRPRGKNEAEDKALEAELKRDEKERAEHIMLVDLGRNDLGRVCQPGSVRVTEMMSVEYYSHVMHLVSNITGRLAPGKDAFDLFRASFPAGTVTGAPKVRAMEIIEELEPEKRGPYAGAVGYFDFAGNSDTCITIRTILVSAGKACVQVGAGIVADSVPEKEYQETLNKGKALLEALRLVASGGLETVVK